MSCKARRQGSDQMYCPLCLTTWDYDDPNPPLCVDKEKYKDIHQAENPDNKDQKTRRFTDIHNRRTFKN